MSGKRPPDWSGRVVAALAVISFALGTWGFRQHLHDVSNPWLDAAYRSLQMFFMNFEHPQSDAKSIEFSLQAARYLAFVTTIWVIIKAFFPQVRQAARRLLRRRGKSCALILGYGPVGQAIGRGLRQSDNQLRHITAVHPALTPELAARAWMDGVLLLEGDPSDPRTLSHSYAKMAERIYVSDVDDLRAIDTAVAVRQHIQVPNKDIRVLLSDSAVAGQMAEAAGGGFLGVSGLRWFSLADETARQMIAEARFDRVAVETGAKQLHLVILGCGSQGEAVAVEALLTGWRTRLGPPRITFLDKDVTKIEARMRLRMPAWFLQPDGEALPESARPELDFRTCDADTLDFARDACLEGLREGISGWVFATGTEALNLRASLSLHRAIMMRAIDPAPIYVRIPGGHADEAPNLVGQPVTLVHTFGSIDNTVARSPLLSKDPDAFPKKLHAAYARASVEMGLSKSREDWTDLSESKRNANRALFRHAAMKLEDFGTGAQHVLTALPRADPLLCQRLAKVDASLDYSRINANDDAQEWLSPSMTLSADEALIAIRLRDAAICEHNRWTVERALEQFIPTEQPDAGQRDDARRKHNNMHDWYDIKDARIRRYDVVLLRGLISEAGEGRTIRVRKLRSRVMCIPVLANGEVGAVHYSGLGAQKEVDVTELRLNLWVAGKPKDQSACIAALMKKLRHELDPERRLLPNRLRFDFSRPPNEAALALSNMLAVEVTRRFGSKILVEPFWAWKACSGPTIGLVGHRDLTGFSSEEALSERLRETFMTLAVQRRAEGLVCGFAPGGDQLAVTAWNSLGLPLPRLVFPYHESNGKDEVIFHTDDPAFATPFTAFPVQQLAQVGKPVLPDNGTGHLAQAESVLARADILLAIVDETRDSRTGGTMETVMKAREQGLEVMIIGPDKALQPNP